MKKTLGIVLALVMVLGSLFVPLTFTASAETLGSSYRFDFSNPVNQHTYSRDEKITYKGREFSSMWSLPGWGWPSVTYPTVGDKTVMRVQAPVSTVLVLLDKDGKPFEMQPGHTYTIKYKVYNPVSAKYNQFAFNAGISTDEDDTWTNNTTDWKLGWFTNTGVDGTKLISGGSTIWNATKNGVSVLYANKIVGSLGYTGGGTGNVLAVSDLDNYITTATDIAVDANSLKNSAAITTIDLANITYEGTKTVYMPSNDDYPADKYSVDGTTPYVTTNEQGAVTYNVPYWSGAQTVETTDGKAAYVGTTPMHNYLSLNISGGEFTNADSSKHPAHLTLSISRFMIMQLLIVIIMTATRF